MCEQIFNAKEARELSANSCSINLGRVISKIKNKCLLSLTDIEVEECECSSGVRIKLKELGFTVSGSIRNGGVNKFIISWNE
jgi:hypothetical protein